MIETTTVADLFTDWDIPWIVTSALAVITRSFTCAAGRASAARGRRSFRHGGMAAFLGGIAALFAAVASPLDTFSESLLFMHMAQHFVLMSVAPPLIVLGAPVVPMLRGLPRVVHPPAAPALCHARPSRCGPLPHASARGLAGHECRVHWMAHSARLRVRALLGELAQLRARLLFLHQPDVLVAGHPAMAEPIGAIALDADSLSTARGRGQHRECRRFSAFRDGCFIRATERVPRPFGFGALNDRLPPELSCGCADRWST